jgi:hypothetical protein
MNSNQTKTSTTRVMIMHRPATEAFDGLRALYSEDAWFSVRLRAVAVHSFEYISEFSLLFCSTGTSTLQNIAGLAGTATVSSVATPVADALHSVARSWPHQDSNYPFRSHFFCCFIIRMIVRLLLALFLWVDNLEARVLFSLVLQELYLELWMQRWADLPPFFFIFPFVKDCRYHII